MRFLVSAVGQMARNGMRMSSVSGSRLVAPAATQFNSKKSMSAHAGEYKSLDEEWKAVNDHHPLGQGEASNLSLAQLEKEEYETSFDYVHDMSLFNKFNFFFPFFVIAGIVFMMKRRGRKKRAAKHQALVQRGVDYDKEHAGKKH